MPGTALALTASSLATTALCGSFRLLRAELLASTPEQTAGELGDPFLQPFNDPLQPPELGDIATMTFGEAMHFSPQLDIFLAQARLWGRRHALHPNKKCLLCPAKKSPLTTARLIDSS